MSDEASDETLVMNAQAGDRVAFSRLLERHYDLIFRVGFRVLGSEADAEDMAQEICMALPRKIGAFRGESRFKSWLYTIVLNACRDSLRRRATYASKISDWGAYELLRRAENDERDDGVAWLLEAMATLSPDLRETAVLVICEDMKHAEAASCLGVSEGTISWRMSEVKKALKDLARKEDLLDG